MALYLKDQIARALEDILADGPKTYQEVVVELEQHGYKMGGSVGRAARDLGVVKRRLSKHVGSTDSLFTWELP